MAHKEPNPKQHEVIAELNNKYGVERWDMDENGSCILTMEDGPWKTIVVDEDGNAE